MNEAQSQVCWPEALEACVARCSHFNNVLVLRETESTQDAAVRMRAEAGTVVTTMRQTAGRGRLGRAWADTASDGIAVTLVVERAAPERLAILSAVAASRAAAMFLEVGSNPQRVCIRWPNDIDVNKRKLAGILVEQDDRTARIGVGMNIAQQNFPEAIAAKACSFAQFGVDVSRLDAIAALIECFDAALTETDDALCTAFASRDVLRGSVATFEHDRQTITGTVVDIDPMHGLRVAAAAGEVFLPAHSTSLITME